jgi:hypothetical protein
VPALAWLALTLVAGVAAYLAAWPAWQEYREREGRDTNTERYLAWRGRARRGPRPNEGMTGEERRRIYAGVALALLAAAALVAFFVAS